MLVLFALLLSMLVLFALLLSMLVLFALGYRGHTCAKCALTPLTDLVMQFCMQHMDICESTHRFSGIKVLLYLLTLSCTVHYVFMYSMSLICTDLCTVCMYAYVQIYVQYVPNMYGFTYVPYVPMRMYRFMYSTSLIYVCTYLGNAHIPLAND